MKGETSRKYWWTFSSGSKKCRKMKNCQKSMKICSNTYLMPTLSNFELLTPLKSLFDMVFVLDPLDFGDIWRKLGFFPEGFIWDNHKIWPFLDQKVKADFRRFSEIVTCDNLETQILNHQFCGQDLKKYQDVWSIEPIPTPIRVTRDADISPSLLSASRVTFLWLWTIPFGCLLLLGKIKWSQTSTVVGHP